MTAYLKNPHFGQFRMKMEAYIITPIMDPSTTIDLAGLCLVVVIHAGILALRLGISLKNA